MVDIVIAVVTALIGLLGIVVTAVLSFLAGVFLERHGTNEWARKERWSFKRRLYENLLQAVGAFRSAQANQWIAAKWIVKLKNADPITDAELRLRDELDASLPELGKKSEAADDMFKLALQRATFSVMTSLRPSPSSARASVMRRWATTRKPKEIARNTG